MTATADKVEDYYPTEIIIKDHIQYYAHDAQVSISTLVKQGLMDKAISNQIIFGNLPKVPKGTLTL